MNSGLLVSAESAGALDAEAEAEWGFAAFSLVEAAGRSCARVLAEALPGFFGHAGNLSGFPAGSGRPPRITVLAGPGNNGADAMVMLRYWLLRGLAEASASALIVSRPPGSGEGGPRPELFKSLKKMDVPVLVWDEGAGGIPGRARTNDPSHAALSSPGAILARSDIIVDGIAGTGLRGPVRGAVSEMVKAVNILRIEAGSPFARTDGGRGIPGRRPLVVSVDLPSGNSDEWEPGMPVIEADFTLAIEPQKYCIYTPSARPFAGTILPVGGIFPKELIRRYRGAELLDWKTARRKIPEVRPDTYKNERGTVEIHAGSPGTSGAALIAARGAQAAGAGLIRLVADNEIYPVLAAQAAGIMVAPAGKANGLYSAGRPLPESSAAASPIPEQRPPASTPDAILLGPGWGTKPERMPVLEQALALEKKGVPLILDADAIELAREKIFTGNTILTPHPGELSRYTGISREKLLCRPAPALLEYARERKAFIVYKSHVITIAAPDGRLGLVDGMSPGLASGGSGDLLAGFCAAVAARMRKKDGNFDLYACAAAAVSLLIASGKSRKLKNRFTDPLELADKAADLAGRAWLGGASVEDSP